MSFKIIQEFRKPGYIIIPEGLENNGVFWYPPLSWSTKKRHNILRNKFYLPDKTLWEARPCVVRKNRIPTYELAEEEEEKLLQKKNYGSHRVIKEEVIVLRSDESSDEESLLGQTKVFKSEPNQSPKRRLSRSQSVFSEQFTKDVKVPITVINDEMWNCFQNTSSTCNFRCRMQSLQNSGLTSASTRASEIPAINNNCDLSQHSFNGGVNKKEKDNIPDYDSECDSIGFNSGEKTNGQNATDALTKILKSQQQHQEEIGRQLQELKRYIQDGFSTIFLELQNLKQIQYSNSYSSVSSDFYPKKFCMENFKKVSTWDDANQLEQMLMISEFKEDMIEKISTSIGTKGSRLGKGLESCQQLIEILFQEEFLKICSWNDASTKQIEDSRIIFFQFQNIISLFTSVILNLDPEFTYERIKEFFIEVLQNSSNLIEESSHTKSIHDVTRNQSWKPIKCGKRQNDDDNLTKEKPNKKTSSNINFDSKIDKLLQYANKSLGSLKDNSLNGNDADGVNLQENGNLDKSNVVNADAEMDGYLEGSNI